MTTTGLVPKAVDGASQFVHGNIHRHTSASKATGLWLGALGVKPNGIKRLAQERREVGVLGVASVPFRQDVRSNSLQKVLAGPGEEHAVLVPKAGSLDVRPKSARQLPPRERSEVAYSELAILGELDGLALESSDARRNGVLTAVVLGGWTEASASTDHGEEPYDGGQTSLLVIVERPAQR